MIKNILLVEPEYPIPKKSKNHHNFIPIGLLKIATLLMNRGNNVKLLRGFPKIDEIEELKSFNPDEIWVSSLFTYWSKYVINTVKYYKKMFPNSFIQVGGIYASLLEEEDVKKQTGCDKVVQGVIPEAENFEPAYELLNNINDKPIDYQIIHTSRGCPRKCSFCGTWKIEPVFIPEKTIKNKIKYKKIIFYDNNIFYNPYIKNILNELIELKKEGKILWCESQSGFDGRLLLNHPDLAILLKKAGFRYPRIAWDWGYEQWTTIKEQIDILTRAGYKPKDIYVFVLYNWNISFEEMEKKRIKCFEWNVQIADCRFRPLDQLYDNYNPKKNQSNEDYFINEDYGWTDSKIKQFRKNVRDQNICIRHGFPFYSQSFEHKKTGKEIMKKVKTLKNIDEKKGYLNNHNIDYWIPNKIRYPKN